MHITDYDKIKELTDLCLFIFDAGDNIGTKTIFAKDLAKSIFSLVDAGTVSDAFVMGELEKAAKYAADDKLLVGTSEGNKYAALSDIYEILDPVISLQTRRKLFRGKNLGSVYTEVQRANIANRSFKGLFLGDYWTNGTQAYRIADFDYYMNYGTVTNGIPSFSSVPAHIVVLTQGPMYSAKFSDISTVNGYMGSAFVTGTNLALGEQNYDAVFGSAYTMAHLEQVSSSADANGITGWAWLNTKVILPTQAQIFGYEPHSYITNNKYFSGSIPEQLALFKYALHEYIGQAQTAWLGDVINQSSVLARVWNGSVSKLAPNKELYITPLVAVKGV